MRLNLSSIILLSGMLLAACASAATPVAPTKAPVAVPTETPAAPKPGGLITKPEAANWANAPQAALNARTMLADQLKVDIDLIGLVSVEQVDWPDACLGIQQTGTLCAQVITTGYKVVLSSDGQEYEFHTNEKGDVVRLVTK